MWRSGRRVVQCVSRCFSVTAPQNSIVVERCWKVPLSKIGKPPKLHPRRHKIYKLVYDSKHYPTPKMELLLTQTVPRLGGRGDTVFVKKSIGRNKLLPQGLAVYPSPENKHMFAEELRLLREGGPGERIQTRTGQLTIEFIKEAKLVIQMLPYDKCDFTKEIVCRQLLKQLGLVVPPHALTLPDEPIKDVGEYWCEITVNGIDTVQVPMLLLPYERPSASYQWLLESQREELAAADTSVDLVETAVTDDTGRKSSQRRSE
ncbi:39S ribosomal protein L9, mitochondrial [Thalassophryne amazonica]|uniref:39S ribosomal protein L9, mitochondrial n=1 Tax=Thalassophryne amazonica TaxID=390379 RepID=UPI001471EA9D|nr:39S ribosomal protein L9, mitochondrial [Thalassophryne amazonica]